MGLKGLGRRPPQNPRAGEVLLLPGLDASRPASAERQRVVGFSPKDKDPTAGELNPALP